jgi:murein DD-endopeptidase MepM/ murein hydrolase activator NlpD
MEEEKGLFHWPVNPVIINQKFGENKACVDLNNQVITCDGFNPPAGYKSLYGSRGHLGLDLGISHGQEVYNAQKGMVSFIDTNPKSGLDVRVVSVINGVEYKCIYEHLLGYQARVGDILETGQLIGWADNTGYSSGDHLHFQIEKDVNNVWIAIDPLPLMSNMFAKDVLYTNKKLKYISEQLAVLLDKISEFLRK